MKQTISILKSPDHITDLCHFEFKHTVVKGKVIPSGHCISEQYAAISQQYNAKFWNQDGVVIE